MQKTHLFSYRPSICVIHVGPTLEAAKKRMPKIATQVNKLLNYYSITLSSIFGAKQHKTLIYSRS